MSWWCKEPGHQQPWYWHKLFWHIPVSSPVLTHGRLFGQFSMYSWAFIQRCPQFTRAGTCARPLEQLTGCLGGWSAWTDGLCSTVFEGRGAAGFIGGSALATTVAIICQLESTMEVVQYQNMAINSPFSYLIFARKDKIYVHFLTYLDTEMLQVVEILKFWIPGHVCPTIFIIVQQMTWRCQEPQHQLK